MHETHGKKEEDDMSQALEEKVLNLNLMEKGPHDPEIVRKVAQYKRLAEKWTLDAAFRDDYERDPVKAIAATGFDISPEAFDLLIDTEALKKRVDDIREGRRSLDDLPESFLLYKGFIREKLEDREKMRIPLSEMRPDALRVIMPVKDWTIPIMRNSLRITFMNSASCRRLLLPFPPGISSVPARCCASL